MYVSVYSVIQLGNASFGEAIEDLPVRGKLWRHILCPLTQQNRAICLVMPQSEIMENARVSCRQVSKHQMWVLQPESPIVEGETSPQHLITTENSQRYPGCMQGWQQDVLIDGEERRTFLTQGHADRQ
jgi:hypothetical protein